jgi:hypothetical protein
MEDSSAAEKVAAEAFERLIKCISDPKCMEDFLKLFQVWETIIQKIYAYLPSLQGNAQALATFLGKLGKYLEDSGWLAVIVGACTANVFTCAVSVSLILLFALASMIPWQGVAAPTAVLVSAAFCDRALVPPQIGLNFSDYNFAVAGNRGVGKSSLINGLIGVQGKAKSDVVEATRKSAKYDSLFSPYVKIWDLPGAGERNSLHPC